MHSDMEWVLASEDGQQLERRLRIANAKVVFATYLDAVTEAAGKQRVRRNPETGAYYLEPLAPFPLTKPGAR